MGGIAKSLLKVNIFRVIKIQTIGGIKVFCTELNILLYFVTIRSL